MHNHYINAQKADLSIGLEDCNIPIAAEQIMVKVCSVPSEKIGSFPSWIRPVPKHPFSLGPINSLQYE